MGPTRLGARRTGSLRCEWKALDEDTNNLVTRAMADAMKQALEQQVEDQLSRMTASLHLAPALAQAARTAT